MSSEIASYFNQISRSDDIALILEPDLDLLPEVGSGQIRVGFQSWAEAEQALPGLAGEVDIVGYNPEHGPHTPDDEKENLIATVQRAAEFSHDLGLRFMVAPDRGFANQYLSEIALYADMIGLQGQRIQNDPQEFESWMREMIGIARASNPNVRIIVQVGATQGTATQMLTAIQTIADEIDGISVWSIRRTFGILQEFVDLIRPSN